MRKPFQGVWNIIRFNWHFYVVSIGIVALIFTLTNYFGFAYGFYTNILCLAALCSISVSLLVSFYVYDVSNLYKLDWTNELKPHKRAKIVNFNVGFDETSSLLVDKFKNAEVRAFDFYDAARHTEISIKRARKAYPPFPNTIQTDSLNVLLEDDFADKIFVILAAHEIRDADERKVFFKELRRILNPGG